MPSWPPPSPTPTPEPPKKSNGVKIAAIVGACIVALALIGSLDKTPSTAPSNPTGGTVESRACIDKDSSVEHADQATAALTDAGEAADRGDAAGMVSSLREAASYIRLAAQDVAADPSISGPLIEAATHDEAAADALEAGDFTTGNTELALGTTAMQQATAATTASTADVC